MTDPSMIRPIIHQRRALIVVGIRRVGQSLAIGAEPAPDDGPESEYYTTTGGAHARPQIAAMGWPRESVNGELLERFGAIAIFVEGVGGRQRGDDVADVAIEVGL